MLKGFVFLLLDFASIYIKSTLNALICFVTKCVDMYHINAFCINFFMQNASTLPTHFVTKNQNVTIVTLVQNALYQGLHHLELYCTLKPDLNQTCILIAYILNYEMHGHLD